MSLVCETLRECSGRRSEAMVKGDDERTRLTVAVASLSEPAPPATDDALVETECSDESRR
jgi:hypothetical protein